MRLVKLAAWAFAALVCAIPALGAEPVLRFGIITDLHHAERPIAEGRYYQSALGKMDEFVKEMSTAAPDFVIELGDFKDQDARPVKQNTVKYLETIEAHFAAFKGPRYHVLGNHDLDSLSKAEFQARVTNTGVPQASTYYSFDHRGIHCVVLDGCFTKDGTAYDNSNFTWQDANIPEAQQKWLAADLAAHRLPTLVFVHQRLDLADTKDENIKQAASVRKILEDSRQVIAAFSGHDHAGGYTLINGIHYLTMVGTIQGGADVKTGNAFSLASVWRDQGNAYRLEIQGFHRQRSRGDMVATLDLPPAAAGKGALGHSTMLCPAVAAALAALGLMPLARRRRPL